MGSTARLMTVAVAIAVVGGLVTSALEAGAVTLRRSCGNDAMCYSVPGGCGVGVGCQTAYCYMVECPSILGGDGICKFCEKDS